MRGSARLRQYDFALNFLMTMRKKLTLTVLATLLLSACGQRGPLYLPEQAPQNHPTESPSAPEDNAQQGGA